jgi:PTS system nitrogen regulatory IIA component
MDRIFIGVREMATNMGVSEKTIYRMLNDNQFPFAVKIGGQWRFRADSVEKWLTSQSEAGSPRQSADYGITLSAALLNGSVLYRIHGANRDEALDELLSTLPRTSDFNSRNFKFSILDREALAPSSLAGIACMSPSVEHPVFVDRSLIILAYLEQPTDFKAMDSVPAEIVFLILPANLQEMAILRTRLQRLLMEPDFIGEIMAEPPRKKVLDLIRAAEERLLVGTPGKTGKRDGATSEKPATPAAGIAGGAE